MRIPRDCRVAWYFDFWGCPLILDQYFEPQISADMKAITPFDLARICDHSA